MDEEFSELVRRFRREMPIAERFAYFDHAAVAPLPAVARDAIIAWANEAAAAGDTVWSGWEQRADRVRQLAAEMIGASAAEIAIVANTTTGIGIVAEGFPWQAGDNVVTLSNEFPSNLFPWLNLAARGVETRRVPVEGVAVDLDRLAAACDDRTRMISVSWVGYATGWRLPLDELVELAHRRGIRVFVDAIQGLGVFPLDLAQTPIDFLAADGHKWLLGPEGAGLLFVRRERLEELRPLLVGWNSVVHRHDFSRGDLDLRPTAARYEGGSHNSAGIAGLAASLELLAELGLTSQNSPIADRIFDFNRRAAERLRLLGAVIVSDLAPDRASGILAFDLPGRDLPAIRRRCLQTGVVLSIRNGWLRLSPHAYADASDLDRLLAVLENSD